MRGNQASPRSPRQPPAEERTERAGNPSLAALRLAGAPGSPWRWSELQEKVGTGARGARDAEHPLRGLVGEMRSSFPLFSCPSKAHKNAFLRYISSDWRSEKIRMYSFRGQVSLLELLWSKSLRECELYDRSSVHKNPKGIFNSDKCIRFSLPYYKCNSISYISLNSFHFKYFHVLLSLQPLWTAFAQTGMTRRLWRWARAPLSAPLSAHRNATTSPRSTRTQRSVCVAATRKNSSSTPAVSCCGRTRPPPASTPPTPIRSSSGCMEFNWSPLTTRPTVKSLWHLPLYRSIHLCLKHKTAFVLFRLFRTDIFCQLLSASLSCKALLESRDSFVFYVLVQ